MKNKKILLIIIPIVLVAIITVAFAILYFTTDLFKSNQELFAKYFAQNAELFDIIKSDNADLQEEFKKTNSYTANGELTVTIENGANKQAVKALTTSRKDLNTGRFYTDMAIKNGEADLLKMSFIKSDDVYAIKLDDILANYMGIRNSDLKTVAKNLGMSEEQIEDIPNSINFDTISNFEKISEEQKQHIIDTYTNVVIESITKDKYTKIGKEQIIVDNANCDANVYKLTLDENTIKQTVINCLNTLKGDNKTLVIISNILSDGSGYTDITKLAQLIGNMASELQGSNTGNAVIEIKVYEVKGKTVKTTLELLDFAKIAISKTKTNGIDRATITIELNDNSEMLPQIIFEKKQMAEGITKNIIITDVNNMKNYAKTSTTLGNNISNTINNQSEVIISLDGEIISSTYVQKIQATSQVEEIMELKNSNTVIFNNYSAQQLTPFLEGVGNKMLQVFPEKIGQLGVDLNINQTSITRGMDTVVKILTSAGLSIANVNVLNTEAKIGIGIAAGTTLSAYSIYSVALDALEGTSLIEEEQRIQAQEEANLIAYIEERINANQ